jgi:hypothetical protein
MTTTYDHKANSLAARQLLEQLVPEAEKRIPGLGVPKADGSAFGANTYKYLHFNRMTGVHVFEGSRGGWLFDLTFEGMPSGVPNVIGQPVAYPFGTREEAVDNATHALAVFLRDRDRTPPPLDGAEALFPFDEVIIRMPSETITMMENASDKPFDRVYAMGLLEEIRQELTGGASMTEFMLEQFSREQKARLTVVCALAICSGIVRWPPSTVGIPRASKGAEPVTS